MILSLPSFLAAVTRASRPPTWAADFAVAAFRVEAVLPPPQAVSRTRAPARRPSRLMAASPFIALSLRAGRRWPESRTAAGERIPCSPPQCRADLLPRLKHLRDRMSRKEGFGLRSAEAPDEPIARRPGPSGGSPEGPAEVRGLLSSRRRRSGWRRSRR